MIYKYFKVTSKIIRPIIPILLKSEKRVMLYSALIDSGADYCIFSLDIADALEIKLKRKNKLELSGIGKENIIGFWDRIELRIDDKTFISKVIFAGINEYGHGILGQLGFFDHFDIKLSYHRQIIAVEQIRLTN